MAVQSARSWIGAGTTPSPCFGLTGTRVLAAKFEPTFRRSIRVERAIGNRTWCAALRGHPRGQSPGGKKRRVVARIEATRLGLDIRFVVTNIATGTRAIPTSIIVPEGKPRT